MRQIVDACRKRWTVEGMFGRLDSVLHSETADLGQPRAALLAFAISVLAYSAWRRSPAASSALMNPRQQSRSSTASCGSAADTKA